jgi:hypothetical protein
MVGALAELSDHEDRDELTADESRRYAEQEIWNYLGLSLAEFLKRAEQGTLPDKPVVPHLLLITGARTTQQC